MCLKDSFQCKNGKMKMESAAQASVLSRQVHFEGKLINFNRLLIIDEDQQTFHQLLHFDNVET